MTVEIIGILGLGVLSFFLLSSWKKRGFFLFPSQDWTVSLRFTHLIGAFAIYFLVTFFSSLFLSLFWRNQILSNYLAYSSWLNFAISFLVFSLLGLYLLFLPKTISSSLLRRPGEPHSLQQDLRTAFYAWILSFPLVLFLNQAIELIVFKIFQIIKIPDQLAVKFLKSTFDNPLYFFLAVVSIVLLAPLIEETLFRGFLQTYIRRHLGHRQAILITSVCFSLFHYSAGQGLGNIPIICSLFVLSLFLGFVYEKQGSLFASMALHSLFNTVSVVNLYLFGGFTTGL